MMRDTVPYPYPFTETRTAATTTTSSTPTAPHRASNGVGVKALRPLRGRPAPESDPDAYFGALIRWVGAKKRDHSSLLDRTRSFRDDLWADRSLT